MRHQRPAFLHSIALVFLFLCLIPSSVATFAGAARAQSYPGASLHQNIQIRSTVALHPASADVTATVVVSPTTIEAGQTVVITGSGYMAGEGIDLQLSTTTAITSNEHLAYTKATSEGTFKTDATTIPAGTQAGAYQILAIGQNSARHATADLKVTVAVATVSVTPATFAPGDILTVQGTKFGKGEKIIISVGSPSGSASVPIGQAFTNHAGSFGPVHLRAPFGMPAGKLLLIASGTNTNKQATQDVTVNSPAPTLTVSPTTAKPGDKVTITGTHFQPGETILVDLVALATSAKLGTTQVNSAGTFSLSATVPANTPEGTVSAVATGTTSHLSAASQIKIGALPSGLSVGNSTIKAGDTVSVTGKGFIPGETVSIQLSGGKLAAFTLATVVAGPDGSFSIDKLVVPTLVAAGSYTLTASGQISGRTAANTLTVQAPPPAAPILSIIDTTHSSGTPYLLSPGGLVQVAGSNFPAGQKVTLALAGATTIPLAIVSVNGSGVLGPIGVTLPANTPAGAYSLQALVAGKKLAALDTKIAPLSPHLSLSTGNLTPGATVTVQGSGFAPGEQVVLALNGAALLTKPTTILAGSNGGFTVTFVVPATVINGTNIVIATGASSRASVSANLTARLAFATRWYFVNGDTTAGNRTTISMLNPTDAPATVKMTFLYDVGPEQTYTQVVQAHSEAAVGLGLVAGFGRHVSTILEADRQISAASTVSYGGGDSTTALGAPGPSTTWYLAEGYTNGSFREYLEVMNPNPSFATIDVRFLPFNNRPAREVRFVMQPLSNIQIDAGQYMPAQSISAIVTADKGVVVERSMRFGAGGRGAHDKIGITTASTVWLFAQGESSGDRQTFFTILNPNQAAPAAVTATFFDRTGKPVGSTTIIVNPLHRGNIKLNDVLPAAQVATVMTSNVPVVVERPFYLGPANLGVSPAGSVIFGRNGGGLSWAFPGGSTASGTQSMLYLFNPGLKVAAIHATFYTESGSTITADLSLPPNSDTVLPVNSVSGMPAGRYGAVLQSTNGQVFLAEQSDLNQAQQQLSSTQGIAQ